MIETLLIIALLTSTIFTIVLITLPTQYLPDKKENVLAGQDERHPSRRNISIQILVLGDIGRSPRMQYHALSAAKHGASVQLIGYLDTEPLPELKIHPNVEIISLPKSPDILQTSNKALFVATAPLKVLYQIWGLWRILGYRARPSKWLLVQNPPSIPTLFIATLACFLRQTRLVIDWHNFGYTILAIKLGQRHPFVQLSEIYEKTFARSAYSHLSVTNVMKKTIKSKFVNSASVLTLHDRPASIFQPLLPSARIAFLSQHPLTTAYFSKIIDSKTRLVVSSTSWTPDEDFSVLLKALCQYSQSAITTSPQLPELLVIITGKGPQQAHYLDEINKLKANDELEMITIKTAWLSFDDYAGLLGSADLGVSLHTSSSGVDLPMKVVDMFGAGLPVLGFDNFEAWSELVTENINGRGFSSAEQMGDILEQLFEPGNPQLDNLKTGALKESKHRWDNEWDNIAGRLFELVT